MITHDFGSMADMERGLLQMKRARPRLFLLYNKGFTSWQEWAVEAAQTIHGPMTPEQFFEGWDQLLAPGFQDRYPAYPRRFLHFFCRDDPAFRRACREVWRDRNDALITETPEMEDWTLNLVPDMVITGLRISFYFAIGFGVLNATQLPIDTLTLSLMLMTALFTWVVELLMTAILGASGRVVRRVWRRRAFLKAHRPAAHEQQQ
jgi:hypothetical protein